MALLLLARLRHLRIADYEELRKLVKSKVKGGDVLFLPALDFLYLLGLIAYRAKTDAIEYVGPNEAV